MISKSFKKVNIFVIILLEINELYKSRNLISPENKKNN